MATKPKSFSIRTCPACLKTLNVGSFNKSNNNGYAAACYQCEPLLAAEPRAMVQLNHTVYCCRGCGHYKVEAEFEVIKGFMRPVCRKCGYGKQSGDPGIPGKAVLAIRSALQAGAPEPTPVTPVKEPLVEQNQTTETSAPEREHALLWLVGEVQEARRLRDELDAQLAAATFKLSAQDTTMENLRQKYDDCNDERLTITLAWETRGTCIAELEARLEQVTADKAFADQALAVADDEIQAFKAQLAKLTEQPKAPGLNQAERSALSLLGYPGGACTG